MHPVHTHPKSAPGATHRDVITVITGCWMSPVSIDKVVSYKDSSKAVDLYYDRERERLK